jgi:hypothetical protein
MMPHQKLPVYVEVATKRVFAGALDWPGWCRAGRDEASALQALFDYGLRYARVMRAAKIDFSPPAEIAVFSIAERLAGNTTTDFGSPDASPRGDENPVDEAQLKLFHSMLQACWKVFDETAKKAAGKELRKGPRGGGRDLDAISRHVLQGEGLYLSNLGWKPMAGVSQGSGQQPAHTRQAMLDGLTAAAHGELAIRGPRGGLRWTPRYFVRRAAWHVLDHAWEIEDRST